MYCVSRWLKNTTTIKPCIIGSFDVEGTGWLVIFWGMFLTSIIINVQAYIALLIFYCTCVLYWSWVPTKMNTYISSKSGTLLLSACQDWQPLSARADSQDCGDDGDHEDCGGQELQPCTDGLPMFPEDSLNVEKELGVIFENLEEQLPEVPLPGPPVPQIPSPPRDKVLAEGPSSPPAPVVDKEVETGPGAGSSKVVATPCRAPSTSFIGTPATLKDSSSPETHQKDRTLFSKNTHYRCSKTYIYII